MQHFLKMNLPPWFWEAYTLHELLWPASAVPDFWSGGAVICCELSCHYLQHFCCHSQTMAPCFFDKSTRAFLYFGSAPSAVAMKFFMSQHWQRRPLLQRVHRRRIAPLNPAHWWTAWAFEASCCCWCLNSFIFLLFLLLFFIFIILLTPHNVFKGDISCLLHSSPALTSCYSNLPTCRGLHRQSSGVKCHARWTTGEACLHARHRQTQVTSASWDGAGIGTFRLSTPLVDWNVLDCWCFWFHLFATSHNSPLVFSQFVMAVMRSDLPSNLLLLVLLFLFLAMASGFRANMSLGYKAKFWKRFHFQR